MITIPQLSKDSGPVHLSLLLPFLHLRPQLHLFAFPFPPLSSSIPPPFESREVLLMRRGRPKGANSFPLPGSGPSPRASTEAVS